MTASTVVAMTIAALSAIGCAPYLGALSLPASDLPAHWWWPPPAAHRRQSLIVGAAAAVAAVSVAAAVGWGSGLPGYLILALAAGGLAVADVQRHRLPTRLMWIAAGGVVLLVIASATTGHWQQATRIAIAGVAVRTVFYLLAFVNPRAVGLGDVNLAGLLAAALAWYTWSTVFTGLALGFLAAGAASVVSLLTRRATRQSHLPLGPFLIPAALFIVALHP